MTDKEKAQAYDKALEVAQKELKQDLHESGIWAIKRIFPQLHENGDEKIRKWIFDLINNMSFENLTESERAKNEEWREKVLAYLEKQKDLDKMIVVSPEVWDKAIADAYENGKKDGEKQKENPEEPKIAFGDWGDKEKKEAIITCLKYMRFVKKITNQEYDDLAEWLDSNLICNLGKGWYLKKREQKEETLRDFIDNFPYSDEQKEQKPIQSEEEKEYVRTLKALVSDFIRNSGGGITDVSYYQQLCDWLDGRHIEQKPAEWNDEDEASYNAFMCEVVNEKMNPTIEQIKWLRDIRDKLKSFHSVKQEWSEEDIKKIRSEEYTKGFNDAAFGGKLKLWSVEDEDRIRQIERIAQEAGCTQKLQEEIHDWLKSLRPSWKPSEEQMKALNALNCQGDLSYVGQQNQLISLYNDLKKLM